LKRKNKHALIRKLNPTSSGKKLITTKLLYNIKNILSIYFLYSMKKKFNKRRKKIKLKISLRKKIKGKEISCWCIGHYSIMHYSWCYCRKKKLKMTMVQIHSVLLTQLKHFYILKKYCYWLTAKREPIC
jgi:hypothetical protein